MCFFQLLWATEEEGAPSKHLVLSCPFNALCDKSCKNHQTFTFHRIFQFFVLKYAQFGQTSQRKTPKNIKCQDCALAMPGGLWHLTFAPGRLENLFFFFSYKSYARCPGFHIKLRALGCLQFFLRAQHWTLTRRISTFCFPCILELWRL